MTFHAHDHTYKQNVAGNQRKTPKHSNSWQKCAQIRNRDPFDCVTDVLAISSSPNRHFIFLFFEMRHKVVIPPEKSWKLETQKLSANVRTTNPPCWLFQIICLLRRGVRKLISVLNRYLDVVKVQICLLVCSDFCKQTLLEVFGMYSALVVIAIDPHRTFLVNFKQARLCVHH